MRLVELLFKQVIKRTYALLEPSADTESEDGVNALKNTVFDVARLACTHVYGVIGEALRRVPGSGAIIVIPPERRRQIMPSIFASIIIRLVGSDGQDENLLANIGTIIGDTPTFARLRWDDVADHRFVGLTPPGSSPLISFSASLHHNLGRFTGFLRNDEINDVIRRLAWTCWLRSYPVVFSDVGDLNDVDTYSIENLRDRIASLQGVYNSWVTVLSDMGNYARGLPSKYNLAGLGSFSDWLTTSRNIYSPEKLEEVTAFLAATGGGRRRRQTRHRGNRSLRQKGRRYRTTKRSGIKLRRTRKRHPLKI
jgi:hypothetical protein